MNYIDFFYTNGLEVQEDVLTNIRYNKGAVRNELLLWYILDTYYNGYTVLNKIDSDYRNTLERALQNLSKEMGACNLILPTI